jgi:hypothetical protein
MTDSRFSAAARPNEHRQLPQRDLQIDSPQRANACLPSAKILFDTSTINRLLHVNSTPKDNSRLQDQNATHAEQARKKYGE